MAADYAALNDQGDALDQHRNAQARTGQHGADKRPEATDQKVDAMHPRAQPCPHARQQGTAAIADGLPPKTGDADMVDRRLGDLYDKYLKPSPYEMEKATQARHRVDWKGALAASVAAVPALADWTSTDQRTRDRRKARFLWRDGSTARSR